MELKNRRFATTVYLEPLQVEGLHILMKRTRLPMAEFIREGLNILLRREGLDEFTETPRKGAKKRPPNSRPEEE